MKTANQLYEHTVALLKEVSGRPEMPPSWSIAQMMKEVAARDPQYAEIPSEAIDRLVASLPEDILLKLRHKTVRDHHETWHLRPDGKIHIVSEVPHNWPPHQEVVVGRVYAMRQVLLMISPVENWEISQETLLWRVLLQHPLPNED